MRPPTRCASALGAGLPPSGAGLRAEALFAYSGRGRLLDNSPPCERCETVCKLAAPLGRVRRMPAGPRSCSSVLAPCEPVEPAPVRREGTHVRLRLDHLARPAALPPSPRPREHRDDEHVGHHEGDDRQPDHDVAASCRPWLTMPKPYSANTSRTAIARTMSAAVFTRSSPCSGRAAAPCRARWPPMSAGSSSRHPSGPRVRREGVAPP